MNLSKLPKTKAYYYQNRETLLKVCERFRINPDSLPKSKSSLGEIERYKFYMQVITNHDPCPICNGPQKVDPARARNKAFFPGGVVCIDHPNHTVAYNMAQRTMRRFAIVIPDGKQLSEDPAVNAVGVDAILRALGPVCSHKHFLMDCEICKERLVNHAQEMEDVILPVEKEVVSA